MKHSNLFIDIYFFGNIVITLAIFFLFFTQEKNKRDISKQEITPVEIGETVAKVKLLIMACITALTPIIYNSVYSDLIAAHKVM